MDGGHRVDLGGGLRVVHIDDALIVLDKPAGMLSVPGRGPDKADCVAERVRRQLAADALVVHRLDMATSGVMVMARGAAAQRALSRAFEQREVDKRYLAVVHGLVEADSGTITAPLAADWPNRPRQRVDHVHGRPSITRFLVVLRDAAAGCSRIELQPVTGRSHQLRVHLAFIGHPIVGDALYAAPSAGPISARLLLQAWWLELPHPLRNERLRYTTSPPF
jgi:tRNA pseudouridine32 synthase / 23S rRNA pseudouridine746 synthase